MSSPQIPLPTRILAFLESLLTRIRSALVAVLAAIPTFRTLWDRVSRISVELSIVVIIGIIILITPEKYLTPGSINPKIAIVTTLLMKAVQASAGFLSGHIGRKMLLPYIDFRSETDPFKKVLVTAFYVLGVYAWVNAG